MIHQFIYGILTIPSIRLGWKHVHVPYPLEISRGEQVVYGSFRCVVSWLASPHQGVKIVQANVGRTCCRIVLKAGYYVFVNFLKINSRPIWFVAQHLFIIPSPQYNSHFSHFSFWCSLQLWWYWTEKLWQNHSILYKYH